MQCKWQYSLAAPATACGRCYSVAESQLAPSGWSHLQPPGPPCACAPAPGGKPQCAGGRGEGARPLWPHDKPAPPLRPLARRTEPGIDPFVTPSIVPGSAALRQRPPSSCPSEGPGLLPNACRVRGGGPQPGHVFIR